METVPFLVQLSHLIDHVLLALSFLLRSVVAWHGFG